MAGPKHDAITRPVISAFDYGTIWSGEHNAWWRPGSAGYTTDRMAAGVYTRAQFNRITSHCGPEKALAFEPIPAGQTEVNDSGAR